MNNRKGKFSLVGFINPFCVRPAFVYPVFTDTMQYFFEDGKGYKIKNFIKADSYLSHDLLYPVEDGKQYSVGDEMIYAFQTRQGKVVYGNGRIMQNYLSIIQKQEYDALLLDEIDDVLSVIRCAISNEKYTALVKKKINVVDRRKDIKNVYCYSKPQTVFVRFDKTNCKKLMGHPSRLTSIDQEPTKAMTPKCEVVYKRQCYQNYSEFIELYALLLDEFYKLYSDLVKIKHPSLKWFQMYDPTFAEDFLRFLILHSELDFKKEDIRTIYHRLSFQNRQEHLWFDIRFESMNMGLEIEKFVHEIKRQMRINMLFTQMLGSSQKNLEAEIPKLESQYVEDIQSND